MNLFVDHSQVCAAQSVPVLCQVEGCSAARPSMHALNPCCPPFMPVQIVQLECLRRGVWGTKGTWGRIATYGEAEKSGSN